MLAASSVSVALATDVIALFWNVPQLYQVALGMNPALSARTTALRVGGVGRTWTFAARKRPRNVDHPARRPDGRAGELFVDRVAGRAVVEAVVAVLRSCADLGQPGLQERPAVVEPVDPEIDTAAERLAAVATAASAPR